MGPCALFASKSGRFVSRARRATVRQSNALLGEATNQAQEGWPTASRLLDADGNLSEEPDIAITIASRFGLSQEGKLRGRGDLKGPLANTTCVIQTPITLCGWDHIADATHLFRGQQREWAFGEVGRRSAHKFPICNTDASYAAIALWCPKSEPWFGCAKRTQLFGITAPV